MTQIDETYVGGKNRGRFKNDRGRSTKSKKLVAGLISKGRVYTVVIPDAEKTTLNPIVQGISQKGLNNHNRWLERLQWTVKSLHT